MVSDERLRMEFAERLKAACVKAGARERGLPVDIKSELNKRGLEITTTAIAKWLKGEAMPGLSHMHALADWLGTTPAALHYGADGTAAPQQNQFSRLEGYAKLIMEECLKKAAAPRMPTALGVLNGTIKTLDQPTRSNYQDERFGALSEDVATFFEAKTEKQKREIQLEIGGRVIQMFDQRIRKAAPPDGVQKRRTDTK